MPHIDINADLGESFGPWKMGNDAQMMAIVSSANIACGGHAGDPATMLQAVEMAVAKGVSIGAHPGFDDKEGFGRRRLPLTIDEVERLVAYQTGALCGIAALKGADVRYVKAHGALANWGAEDADIAGAIVRATRAVLGADAVLLTISGTQLEKVACDSGLNYCSEIFADRGYQPNGLLVPRGQDGAMIHDAQAASARLIEFMQTGNMPTVGGDPISLEAGSICVHGDGPTAVELARDLRQGLEQAGIRIGAFVK
ncbi:LamB/YcsF family protein [Halocynthiibacter sp.]|uniref:LamB/YcsF family protein n=1 Tax=Halocynthiibacter sp. TaxID=1979210 RepID=UPI003C37F5F4